MSLKTGSNPPGSPHETTISIGAGMPCQATEEGGLKYKNWVEHPRESPPTASSLLWVLPVPPHPFTFDVKVKTPYMYMFICVGALNLTPSSLQDLDVEVYPRPRTSVVRRIRTYSDQTACTLPGTTPPTPFILSRDLIVQSLGGLVPLQDSPCRCNSYAPRHTPPQTETGAPVAVGPQNN